jgi:hypothetical protein
MARTKKVKSVFVNDKEWTVESLRELIRSSDAAAVRAMVRINEYQTAYEKEAATTVDQNRVGFASCHAFLSKFVESYNKFGKLTENQMVWVRKAMPKYAGQIFRIMLEESRKGPLV